jgi:hypothetical protein
MDAVSWELELTQQLQKPVCSVIIIPIPRAGRPENLGSILGGVQFTVFATASRPNLDPIQPPIQQVPVPLSPGVKRIGI